jgi:hypothetical protein
MARGDEQRRLFTPVLSLSVPVLGGGAIGVVYASFHRPSWGARR